MLQELYILSDLFFSTNKTLDHLFFLSGICLIFIEHQARMLDAGDKISKRGKYPALMELTLSCSGDSN